mmetsp:Transcript_78738/g.138943  ORF Transcript_78738/g.138943 Transcript_78738/m.138943 type:complete len:246 (-) Transcript_78738:264-1001(-)
MELRGTSEHSLIAYFFIRTRPNSVSQRQQRGTRQHLHCPKTWESGLRSSKFSRWRLWPRSSSPAGRMTNCMTCSSNMMSTSLSWLPMPPPPMRKPYRRSRPPRWQRRRNLLSRRLRKMPSGRRNMEAGRIGRVRAGNRMVGEATTGKTKTTTGRVAALEEGAHRQVATGMVVAAKGKKEAAEMQEGRRRLQRGPMLVKRLKRLQQTMMTKTPGVVGLHRRRRPLRRGKKQRRKQQCLLYLLRMRI